MGGWSHGCFCILLSRFHCAPKDRGYLCIYTWPPGSCSLIESTPLVFCNLVPASRVLASRRVLHRIRIELSRVQPSRRRRRVPCSCTTFSSSLWDEISSHSGLPSCGIQCHWKVSSLDNCWLRSDHDPELWAAIQYKLTCNLALNFQFCSASK